MLWKYNEKQQTLNYHLS